MIKELPLNMYVMYYNRPGDLCLRISVSQVSVLRAAGSSEDVMHAFPFFHLNKYKAMNVRNIKPPLSFRAHIKIYAPSARCHLPFRVGMVCLMDVSILEMESLTIVETSGKEC
jgi:hypothetical protein